MPATDLPDDTDSATAAPPAVRINWWIAVACTAAMALLFAFGSVGLGGVRPPLSTRLATHGLNWGLWLALMPFVFAVSARAHVRPLRDWRNVGFQIVASVAIAVLHGGLVGAARWAVGANEPAGLLYLMHLIVILSFPGDMLRYWLIAAVYHALAYQTEARRRAVHDATMAQHLAEARLESLESRLQPHFLFNALNTIAALIRKDPPAASVMVGQLSDLLRAALSNEVGRQVPLSGELHLLEQYVAIQRTRFSDRLTFSVNASDEALRAYVPQMILQPLVENAIQHGIGPREAPGSVTLEAMRDQSKLRLIVRDNGVGYGSAPDSLRGNGLGLSSTRARLAHLYGDAFAFDVRGAPAQGTVVTIDLPFHTEPRPGVRPLTS